MFTVIGGTYREICLHPPWNEVYGSGLRAAAAVIDILSGPPGLITWGVPSTRAEIEGIVASYGISLEFHDRADDIEFQYDHALGPPRLYPAIDKISHSKEVKISCENALVFGMLESSPVINSDYLVYDPQSGGRARAPSILGYSAKHLAIVANFLEARSMLSTPLDEESSRSPILVGRALLKQEGCEVIVVKNGTDGAYVISGSSQELLPSYKTESVFPIGSGDVFSGIFAASWSANKMSPPEAARLASAATARYCSSRVLPIPKGIFDLGLVAAPMRAAGKRTVYLAGPLYTLSQLWLLNEAKRCLEEQGFSVFSPKDEVGFISDPAQARVAAEADLAGLDSCGLVFAILEGFDPGTIFEIGYARSKAIPVIAYAEHPDPLHLTMITGSGCKVFNDFSTAVYQAGWEQF